jgi:hypothetical protein
MSALRKWSFDKFGAVTRNWKAQERGIEELSSQDHHIAHQEEVDRLSRCMDELLYREEMMWQQRSIILWIKEGNKNTIFFHRKAAGRAKKNCIK